MGLIVSPGDGRRRAIHPFAKKVEPAPPVSAEEFASDTDPFAEVFPRKIKRIDKIAKY